MRHFNLNNEIPNMGIQSQLIIGLLHLVLVRIENTLGLETVCTMHNMAANCAFKNLKGIPQDLEINIEGLNASNNPIEKLGADDFKRYPSLKKLHLRGLILPNGKQIHYDSKVFVSLKNLETLDISESAFNIWSKEIIWPTSLKSLSVAALPEAKFLGLNLSTLNQLEYLNASNNQIEDFPMLHPEAPVYWIDLFDNPLNNVTAEHLAPYCLLRWFRIRVQKGEFNDLVHSCQCRRVEQWMIMHHISGFDGFSCTKPLSGQFDPCPDVKNFSQTMWDQRQACLNRQPTPGFLKWLIIIVLLSLILPSVYLGIELYKSYKKTKRAEGKAEDKTEDASNDNGSDPEAAAPPPDVEDASDPSPDG